LDTPYVVTYIPKDDVQAVWDVDILTSEIAALTTQFSPTSRIRPSYGILRMDLNTLDIVDDSFRIQPPPKQSSFLTPTTTNGMESSNVPLIQVFPYDHHGKTFLYIAHGGMTVQVLHNTMSTYHTIQDSVRNGLFQATTVCMDNGIVVFGGFVQDNENNHLRNYILLLDISLDPQKPKWIHSFPVPNRILSLAIYNFQLFLLVTNNDTEIQTINLLPHVPTSLVGNNSSREPEETYNHHHVVVVVPSGTKQPIFHHTTKSEDLTTTTTTTSLLSSNAIHPIPIQTTLVLMFPVISFLMHGWE
jgi:hypothetical protein